MSNEILIVGVTVVQYAAEKVLMTSGLFWTEEQWRGGLRGINLPTFCFCFVAYKLGRLLSIWTLLCQQPATEAVLEADGTARSSSDTGADWDGLGGGWACFTNRPEQLQPESLCSGGGLQGGGGCGFSEAACMWVCVCAAKVGGEGHRGCAIRPADQQSSREVIIKQ